MNIVAFYSSLNVYIYILPIITLSYSIYSIIITALIKLLIKGLINTDLVYVKHFLFFKSVKKKKSSVNFEFELCCTLITSARWLRKILQHKRHVLASRWNPIKLTHFNGHFDIDSSCYPRQKTLQKLFNLLGIQWLT